MLLYACSQLYEDLYVMCVFIERVNHRIPCIHLCVYTRMNKCEHTHNTFICIDIQIARTRTHTYIHVKFHCDLSNQNNGSTAHSMVRTHPHILIIYMCVRFTSEKPKCTRDPFLWLLIKLRIYANGLEYTTASLYHDAYRVVLSIY